MIRFNGTYSDQSLGKSDIRAIKKYSIMDAVCIVLSVVFIILDWKIKDNISWWMCICAAGSICLAVYLLIWLSVILIRRPKPFVDMLIDDEKIIYNDGADSKEMPISEVVKVRDYGHAYYLRFKKQPDAKWWICQKDLLTEGSIEEFEALFEGKIIRKNTKTKI